MKVLEVKTTSGPNYWSIRRHHLTVMLLDLEEMEHYPTNVIPGFSERLFKLIPSLWEHRCSESKPGGLFERVKEGTWLGHVIEHIALEIQTLAGMDTGFGRTRSTGKTGVYHVVFSHIDAEAGIYAAHAAVAIADALVNKLEYPLADTIHALRGIYDKNRLGPSTAAIVQEAQKRGIPWTRLNESCYVQLGYGRAQRRIEATIASTTGNIAVENACDKEITKQLLKAAYIPVPEGCMIENIQQLSEAIEQTGFPMVIKPVNGNHGKGITTNIRSIEEAFNAFRLARQHGKEILCEQFVSGTDYRILIVNYRFVAAARRSPATVIGDCIHTIQELVDSCNNDPRRGEGHENVLTKITLDDDALQTLAKNGYHLNTIPVSGEEVIIKSTANLSTGGTSTDVTEQVHPDNIKLCERIARVMGLDICGIDIMAPTMNTPIINNGGAVLEVNAAPGLRMHLAPTVGKPRNVAAPIIDMLFPQNATGRIPIIAITGTNGKTTTTRLTAHIADTAGYHVGFTTTDGIYMEKQLIYSGDCTGPVSARVILNDPGVNMAVLECARGGILRAGLAFDQCDIAIITNVAEDHLGLKGIESIKQLAQVKSVVAQAVSPQGYAVLNADDDLVYGMRETLHCRIALFSTTSNHPRIHEHIKNGGVAATFEDGQIFIIKHKTAFRIGPVADMPCTFGGHAVFNIANAMAAALAAFLQNIPLRIITAALQSFELTPENAPGRMNLFEFNHLKVFVDYGHNPHGIKAVGELVKHMPAKLKLGVIAGVGDRRPEDIIAVGATAATYFDELIIRQDKDLRSRTAEEIETLLHIGIRQVAPEKKVTVIREESEAILAVCRYGIEDMIAVIFADDIENVILQLQDLKKTAQFKASPQVEVA